MLTLFFAATAVVPAPDVVRLKNGATFEGAVVEERGDAVRLAVPGGEIVLPRADLLAVERGEPIAAADPKPDRVTLPGGGFLEGLAVEEPDKVVVLLPRGSVEFPRAAVAAVAKGTVKPEDLAAAETASRERAERGEQERREATARYLESLLARETARGEPVPAAFARESEVAEAAAAIEASELERWALLQQVLEGLRTFPYPERNFLREAVLSEFFPGYEPRIYPAFLSGRRLSRLPESP